MIIVQFPLVLGGPPTQFTIHEMAAGWFWIALFRMPHADAIAVLIRRDEDEANELAKREWTRANGGPPKLESV